MNLQKCTLCANMEDPRWGINVTGGRYPLCDGCGPQTEPELRDVAARCRAVGPPTPWTESDERKIERLTKERDAWKAKWEDLETNRAVCCDRMETALREIAALPAQPFHGDVVDCPCRGIALDAQRGGDAKDGGT